MKIEIKNTDFKYLYEQIDKVFAPNSGHPPQVREILLKQLKPQYEKAFRKYEKEEQLFEKGEKVNFRFAGNPEMHEGFVHKVSRLANGQYRYVIKYFEEAEDYHYEMEQVDKDGRGYAFTNPMTKKNIFKIE